MKQAKNINDVWAALMIEELIRQGITQFYIAPGSRSSALTLAAARHPNSNTIVHFDERGLAFRALGFVAASRRPAVLICTSGTAGANFYPAVIEASKKKLPLLVLTADRPPELQYTGSMQTIDQQQLFGKYVKWFFNVPCPTTTINPRMLLTTIDQALVQMTSATPGVVHLNCMFREPLASLPDGTNIKKYVVPIKSWMATQKPFTKHAKEVSLGLIEDIEHITDMINASKKVMLVCGKLSSEEECRAVLAFAGSLQVPVYADVSSGLRLGCPDQNVMHYADHVLASTQAQRNLKPDMVIHLGGRITSKRYYQWIESVQPKAYLMVLAHSLRNDPLHTVTYRIQAKPQHFCDALIPHLTEVKSDRYLNHWLEHNTKVKDVITKEHRSKKAVALSIARSITQCIPSGEGFFISNSMPIRLVDMYGVSDGHPVVVGANRGASGIDGIVSTAIGFGEGLNERVTCLIGDVALLHDLNSLACVKDSSHPIIMVVLNNHGGEIFGHLPIAKANPYFKKYFQTSHDFSFKQAAAMFGLDYIATSSKRGFHQMYQKALRTQKSVLFDVRFDAQESVNDTKTLLEKIGRLF